MSTWSECLHDCWEVEEPSDFDKGYAKGKNEWYVKGKEYVMGVVLQLIDLGLEQRKKIFNTDSVREILTSFNVSAIRDLLEANREVRVGDVVACRTETGMKVGVVTAIDDTICCILSPTGHTCNVSKEEVTRVHAHLPQTLGFLRAVESTINRNDT